MIRSSVVLIPLVTLAVAVSCSSEEPRRSPMPGDVPASSATTGTGGQGGAGGTDGTGGQGAGTGGQGSGTGGQGAGTGGQGAGTGGQGAGTGGQGAGTGGQGAGTGGQGAGTGGQGAGGGDVVPNCANEEKDGDETDVDCGGACAPCRAGQACAAPEDCFSGRCEENASDASGAGSGGGAGSAGLTCAAALCDNGVRDGDETDVDCGGRGAPRGDNPACPGCADLKGCAVRSDCESLSCVAGKCLSPSCSDGVKNGQETDVDCGGICPACMDGAACSQPTDCRELVCIDEVCLPASCSDGVKNGKETDIDCGGTTCSTRCPAGQRCAANGDCATSICNTTTRVCACPASMVIAPVAGGGSYCIDQYEVTKQEYDVFVQANPVLSGLPVACSGNIYRPSSGWPYTEGREPVTHVDWCDAYAYCAYMGKHLCGRIGGGENAIADFDSPARSEWYNACSGQGANDYPYGDTYLPERCVGTDSTTGISKKPGPPVPSPPIPSCVGGVTGLYNMSGNVAEWENSCDALGNCLVRGGSQISDRDHLLCGVKPPVDGGPREPPASRGRLESDPNIGFRCCL
ncbi:SUMF1/EgtB/PvdO family nonheme iron enzyme [Sorangium sp. So ce315]|uniref:formylglycine-generating enzyme family protein n=1 Tax=Sorangium sp. So ce315 TaxID=3133299 RepID=UPI003F61AF02